MTAEAKLLSEEQLAEITRYYQVPAYRCPVCGQQLVGGDYCKTCRVHQPHAPDCRVVQLVSEHKSLNAQLDAARQEAERAKAELAEKRRLLLSAESALTKVLNAAGGVAASYDGIAEQVIAKLNEAKQQLAAISAPGEAALTDDELGQTAFRGYRYYQAPGPMRPTDDQLDGEWSSKSDWDKKAYAAIAKAVASRLSSQHRQQVAELEGNAKLLASQAITILRLDLGYSEKPTYGHHPMRHTFLWDYAESFASADDIKGILAGCAFTESEEGIRTLQSLTAELAQLRKQADGVERDYETLRTAAERRLGIERRYTDGLEATKAEVRHVLGIKEGEHIVRGAEKVVAELAATKEQLAILTTERDNAKHNAIAAARECEELEQKLAARDAELATAKSRLDALSTDLATSEARCGARERELERVRRALPNWIKDFSDTLSELILLRPGSYRASARLNEMMAFLPAADTPAPATQPDSPRSEPEPEAPKAEQGRPAPIGEGEQRQSERAVKELLQEQPKAFDKRRKAHAELVPIDEYERRVGEQPQPAFVCPFCKGTLYDEPECKVNYEVFCKSQIVGVGSCMWCGTWSEVAAAKGGEEKA